MDAVKNIQGYIAERQKQNRPLELATMQQCTGWSEAQIFRTLQAEMKVARLTVQKEFRPARPAHTPKGIREDIAAESCVVTADMEQQLRVLVDACSGL